MRSLNKNALWLIVVWAAVVLATIMLGVYAFVGERAGAQTPPEKPNVLFVMLDDADANVLAEMPETRERVRARGTTFPNTFVPFSTCCPSRATTLRGQYPHNTGVTANDGPTGGVDRFRETGGEADNLATRLDQAGYRTALFGKYLNGYQGGYVPRGWDEWHGAMGGQQNGETWNDGEVEKHDYKQVHETDVYGEKARRFIEFSKGTPWFAYVAFHTPHSPTIVEDGYSGRFAGEVSPKGPSFDEEDVSDKPQWVRRLPRVSDADREVYNNKYRERLRTVQSADDQVGLFLDTLGRTGQLGETYVVVWSDNGYHLGTHRIPAGKRTAYEEDARLPLAIRGPGVAEGVHDPRLVSGIDILPTFLDIANTPAPPYADGRSFLPLAKNRPVTGWRDAVLLEGYDDSFDEKDYVYPDFKAIRTAQNETFVRYVTGEREFYDMDTDPFQVRSRHADPDKQARESVLAQRLTALQTCEGAECRVADGGP